MSLSQSVVAKVLGVPKNRVVVRVKRMGGGFGGKESRSTILSTVVAVAADKYTLRVGEGNCLVSEFPHCSPACVRLKRPVRCMLDRDEDMLSTGGRHPFYGKYKVGGCPPASWSRRPEAFSIFLCYFLKKMNIFSFPVPSLQVGFLSSGKVVALDVSFYSNVGNSLDLSLSVSITHPILRSHRLQTMC